MLERYFKILSATIILLGGAQLIALMPALSPAPALAATAKQASSVSSQELAQFAQALRAVRELDRASRQTMVALVQDAGFEPQRFGAIAESLQTEAEPQPPVSADEQQRFIQVATQISQVQERTQAEMVAAVQAEGLEPERFQEIFAVVRESEALQQQVEQLMQE